MPKCAACQTNLLGQWNMTAGFDTTFAETGRYLGIKDGYFLYGEQPNWVYCYCKNCWTNQINALGSVTAVRQQLTTSQQQLATSQQQHTTLLQQHTTLQQEKTKLEQQKTTVEQQYAALQQQHITLQQQHTTLQQQKTSLKQQITTLRQQYTTSQQKITEWERRAADIRQTRALNLYEQTCLDQLDLKLTSFTEKELEELKKEGPESFEKNSMFEMIQKEVKKLSKRLFELTIGKLGNAVRCKFENTSKELNTAREQRATLVQNFGQSVGTEEFRKVVSSFDQLIEELNKKAERWKSLQPNFRVQIG